MKRKICFFVCMAAIAMTAFAGGGQSAGGNSGAAVKPKLIFACWDNPEENGLNAIAAEFMKQNPDVEVEVQQTPFDRYEDRMRTILSGNDVPDVMQINDDYVPVYADRGLLLPIHEYATKLNLDITRYYEPIWKAGWVGDEMVSFSPGAKVRLIIYNRDMLKVAGLPEPPAKWNDPSWNWDTFLEYAQKLTKKQGNVTTQWGIVGLTGTTAEAVWPGNITGYGLFGADGRTASVSSPEARPGVQYLIDTVLKHQVHPPFGLTSQAGNLFISGQAAMYIQGSQAFSEYRTNATFDWDVAPVPMNKYGRTMPGLVVYAVPKRTKNPDLATKLLFFLGEDVAQQHFARGGNVPITKEFAAKYFPVPNPKSSRLQTVLDGADNFIINNSNPQTDEARRAYRLYLHQAYAGDLTVDEAMEQATADIEAIFKR